MGVASMKYLNVYGPEKMLENALGAIARCDIFAPESDEAIHSAIHMGPNPYEPLLTKAKGLLKDLGSSPLAADFVGDERAYTYDEVAAFLETYAAEVASQNKRRTDLENELELQRKTANLLSHMQDLNIDFDELFSVEYLKVRVGRLPKNSYTRLAYYADKGFNFTQYFNFIIYDFDGEYYWGLYFAPSDNAKDIDDIFNSLYFERLWIPETVHGSPTEAIETIKRRQQELETELNELVSPHGIAQGSELTKIQNMTSWLALMSQIFEMRRYALVFNHTFYISGFVPMDEITRFEKIISDVPTVHIKEADVKEELPAEPPVKLKNNALTRPFEMFTEMYGLPGYSEIDPTPMVAVLYSVLYGIMFADLGQGVVLGLVGYFLMYKMKKMQIGLVLTRAAVFCCLFGFLFGSVFGYENLLDPVWKAIGIPGLPLRVMDGGSIMTILMVSLGIGVAVVIFAICTNIVTCLRDGRRGEALTSPNGVAGLVFYVAVVVFALDTVLFALNSSTAHPLFFIPFIVLPLLVMYFQEPLAELLEGRKPHITSLSDLFVASFFELFVSLLEYLSNTVSFLRVGGFVLAHAGMMTVVMTLAEMASGPGQYAVVAIGNVFVIALEGLIVGIQALRLNYYEVFSRFYNPSGKAFTPLHLSSDTVEM